MADIVKDTKFKYVANNPQDGTVVEGLIQATSEEVVKNYLRKQGLLPLDVTKQENTGLNTEINLPFAGRIKKKHISIWARQFSTMIDAGLAVVRVLEILVTQTENTKLSDITDDIKTRVENGNSLAEAMRHHVDVFGDLIVNMIAAAEAGGFLDTTFRQIAIDLEKDVRLRAKIRSAMTYPIMVLGLAAILVSVMLIFIVPIFEDMFTQLGGELPLPTKMLVFASEILSKGAIPIALAIGGLIFAWTKVNKTLRYKQIVDPLKLRLPVFGKLIQKIALARFSRNFGTLLASEVPILAALDIVADTIGNYVISKALGEVKISIGKGGDMSDTLELYPEVFPSMVTQMIAVGEDAGRIDPMLMKIAEDYDEQVETATEQLSSLIEPLMIVLLGIVIGSAVIALYLPILSAPALVSQQG